ncbi:MAG TPA: phosphoribosylamine--glycine ligase [Polyangia bacterium]|nr:phosphoribosylamine--glycine ligase [Polyangia bacterium]
MKIFLVGSGGREHALAWKIAASPLCEKLVVAPGNPGIAGEPKVTCIPVAADAVPELVAAAVAERADLVVCGPEVALCAGLGDAMRAAGLQFFGPSRAAAEIEGSKAFAKRLMYQAEVPTAAFGVFDDLGSAEEFIDAQASQLVVKADGLAAGKGVTVTSTKEEAKLAARHMLAEGVFGAAGARVVIEERLVGRELSMLALCDGERLALLPTSEDHKAVRDGDQGPNTGGMGTHSPSPLVGAREEQRILDTIFQPMVQAMAGAGRPFQGLLYGGLMLTPERGPMVIEWNCRFGDPETQSVLMRLDEDILPWLAAVAAGKLPGGAPRVRPGAACCVVLAAQGYPEKTRLGDPIGGLPEPTDELRVFHAGTRRDAGRLLTAGGRVLGVTAHGADLDAARQRAYQAIDQIQFDGMHFRRDIGLRGKTTT